MDMDECTHGASEPIQMAIKALKYDGFVSYSQGQIDAMEEVKAIPLDKVEQAREEIENLTPWDEGLVEMYEVLSVLDKLIEEVEE